MVVCCDFILKILAVLSRSHFFSGIAITSNSCKFEIENPLFFAFPPLQTQTKNTHDSINFCLLYAKRVEVS